MSSRVGDDSAKQIFASLRRAQTEKRRFVPSRSMFLALDDLRSLATPPFVPALQPLPPGVRSAFGDEVPFGSSAFACRDAADISPSMLQAPGEPILGDRISGSLWPGERFTLRIPEAWNGRLVIAGCPGQRSEFAGDRIFGDPLLARGYAYASGNKGNGDGVALVDAGASLEIDGVRLPRFALPDGRGLVFWQHAPGHTIERWLDAILGLTQRAQEIITQTRGRAPELTYAVGLSNGGYQVRRAIEESNLFAGALAWNAVLWLPENNLLRNLSGAVAAMEAGKPELLAGLGFPPDVRAASGNGSLYQKNLFAYWYLTLWLHATQLDPETSIAYGDVRDPELAESWTTRIGSWRYDRSPIIAERVRGFANTGKIRCKLIDLASEYDHLVPPHLNFAPYAQLVAASGNSARYRGKMIANAQHVEPWSEDPDYPMMRPGHPNVLRAWEELVQWVEG